MATELAEPPVETPTGAPTLDNWMKNLPSLRETAIAPVGDPGDGPPEPAPHVPPPVQPAAAPGTVNPPLAAPDPAQNKDEPKWPRSAKDWDSYKKASKEREDAVAKERDTIKAERDAVKEEIAKLQKSGPSADLEALKRERDELSERLRVVAVENHPKFKAHFEGRTNLQIDLAKRIVGTDKAGRISEILKTPEGAWRDSQMDDFIAELTPVQQSRLGGVINALSEIGLERETEIANAKSTYERMTKERTEAGERQQKAFQENAQKVFASELSALEDAKNPAGFLFQKKDGNEPWNKELGERVDSAKTLLFGKSNPETLTRAAFHAAAFPAVLKYAIEMGEQTKKLEAQVKALTAVNPTAGAGERKGADGKPARPEIKPGTRPMDVMPGWVQSFREGMTQ